ncbi:multidrug transporter subunit MdtD [Roseateles toxinivorans]|uniref:EmrB/QacA subfamily drug resistance transporter n=1 Tax=Roseateles toxinivorans TaxID=270368 RepID=A0A4R6QUL7_9BURK|nr:multidrug transporter subunit MdtD [Roseateles toxinivorans]TDP74315.1 EmrB/QacA subfamily drug resistance transporter [Roseateles toxinivorans]
MSDPSPRPVLTPAARRFLPWVVALAFFMQTLDTTILNTALPGMARDLGENPLRMQSAVVAYMLTVALLIPASGWLADRFGTRTLFLWAIGLFSAGSLACALSSSLNMLVAARVLQGVGGALLVPVGRLTVLRAFPREEFLPVMTFIAIPGLVGPLIGPALGGLLVEYVSWHWIFLINLPVGVAGVLASLRFMPQLKSQRAAPFDWGGYVLFSLGLMLLSVALQGFGEQMVGSAVAMVLLVAGVASMMAYWLHAARAPEPLFSMVLFTIPTYRIGIIGNVFARLGSGATPFLMPMFLQLGLGFSPSAAGLSMVPTVMGAMLTKTVAIKLIKRLGYRRVLVANTLALGAMIASFALVDRHTTHLWLALHLGLFGMINSMQFTAMNTLTLGDLDAATASSGNSLLSVVMQLSMSLGVATSSTLLLLFSGVGNVHSVLGAGIDLVPAFHATYLAIGSMAALASFIFYQLRHHEGARDAQDTMGQE